MTRETDDRSKDGEGRRDRLLDSGWHYVEKTHLDAFDTDDWALMNRQRARYNEEEIARQVLRMLEVSRDVPTFGYQVNNYRHSIQTATLMLRDGLDEAPLEDFEPMVHRFFRRPRG